MNSELKTIYETYVYKLINCICEGNIDTKNKDKLLDTWRKIIMTDIKDDTFAPAAANICPAIIKSGARKGQICSIQIPAGDESCKRHERKVPAGDKKLCEFILKSGQNCKKYAKENTNYCATHNSAPEDDSPAPQFTFKEEELNDASLYTNYRNGYLHIPTNLYLKLSKTTGRYKVYGIVEDDSLLQIEESEQVLKDIEYNINT